MIILYNKHIEIIEWLINENSHILPTGAYINAKNHAEQSALHIGKHSLK